MVLCHCRWQLSYRDCQSEPLKPGTDTLRSGVQVLSQALPMFLYSMHAKNGFPAKISAFDFSLSLPAEFLQRYLDYTFPL